MKDKSKKYKIKCWILVDEDSELEGETEEYMSYEDAMKEIEHLKFIQPENKYEVGEMEEILEEIAEKNEMELISWGTI